MSSTVGLTLTGMSLEYPGEAGDNDFSENVVVGESPFWGLAAFQPKNDVNPAAGDFGLLGRSSMGEELGDAYMSSSSMKSSVTPSSRNLRFAWRGFSDEYTGRFGMVGDRACVALFPEILNSSALLERWGWTLLAERSCLGTMGLEVE
jgi:hypothetical protein